MKYSLDIGCSRFTVPRTLRPKASEYGPSSHLHPTISPTRLPEELMSYAGVRSEGRRPRSLARAARGRPACQGQGSPASCLSMARSAVSVLRGAQRLPPPRAPQDRLLLRLRAARDGEERHRVARRAPHRGRADPGERCIRRLLPPGPRRRSDQRVSEVRGTRCQPAPADQGTAAARRTVPSRRPPRGAGQVSAASRFRHALP